MLSVIVLTDTKDHYLRASAADSSRPTPSSGPAAAPAGARALREPAHAGRAAARGAGRGAAGEAVPRARERRPRDFNRGLIGVSELSTKIFHSIFIVFS